MGIDKEEDDRRRLNDLSLEACRKRQSSQTGFVHFCYEHPFAARQDTIPLVENFCFVLALFRTRLSEPVLEGKALLEKLLSFESLGNFPVYLHQFPSCKDRSLSVHLLPVFYYLLKDFRAVLGEELCKRLDLIAHRILAHAEAVHAQRPLSLAVLAKMQAFKQNFDSSSWQPESASEWADYLIALQMGSEFHPHREAFEKVLSLWNPSLSAFIGPCKDRHQDKLEPSVTLFDLFMGEFFRSFSQRALVDAPIHMRASLVQPFSKDIVIESPLFTDYQLILEKGKTQCVTLLWGTSEHCHSLVLEAPLGCEMVETEHGLDIIVQYDPELPKDEENAEIALYCNESKEHALFIEEQKANTFQLEERVKVVSPLITIEIKISLEEGSGRFFGHISKSNRSSQTNKQEAYQAYDWKIGLRTLDRSPYCVTRASLAISSCGATGCDANAGLSTASPIACSPLST